MNTRNTFVALLLGLTATSLIIFADPTTKHLRSLLFIFNFQAIALLYFGLLAIIDRIRDRTRP